MPDVPNKAAALLEEQSSRWQRGDHVLVEELLASKVWLQNDPEAVLDLVTNELLLRQQSGESPQLEEYQRRFPHLAEPLALQFEVEQAIHEGSPSLDTASAAPTIVSPRVNPGGETAPPAVPGYEILKELGRGSMGVVFKARHLRLNRVVALKMILAGDYAGVDERLRFLAEAEAIAAVKHPGIVAVFDYGTHDSQPFFSLEFCEGGSLAGRLAGNPLPPNEAAHLVEQMARAVHAAHERGIIHRDLKPGNVLLASDGTPRVTDFGLAKRIEGSGLTATGIVLGTPSYMSPEQARASKDVGPLADVYALGAILYECLTGAPPHKAASIYDTLLQVVHDDPVPPRTLKPKVPRDLETVCLKCLHKQPGRRYSSAAELADDLGRFRAGEPTRARPMGRVERLSRCCLRHPARAAMAACALFVLTFGGFLAWQAYDADQQRRASERKRAEERAQMAAMSGDAQGAAAAIDEAEALDASPGRMHLLRGQVAFYQGDSEGAWRHLEEAVRLMPDSVAARATLALACYHTGRSMAFEKLVRELDAMTPRTAEDYLYKGQLEAITRPEEATRTLDKAVSLRNSVVGWAARLAARTSHALFTDDAVVAQKAIDDARVAKEMLPNNPVVLSRSVNAHLVAWGAFHVNGQLDRSRAALAEAGRDARELEAFPSVVMALTARFQYHLCADDEPAARAVTELGTHFRSAVMLYRHGDYKAALAAADLAAAQGYSTARCERGFILAEMPDGQRLAWQAFQELRAAGDLGYYRVYECAIPLLLGRKADAVRTSREIRGDGASLVPPAARRSTTGLYVDYLCELITEDELLRAAGRCRPMLCEAHFQIALRHLAEDDRDGARDHFQKCVDTRVFIYWDYVWARAFLDRLNSDPRWPKWIGRQR
jgi:tetratricopeptide (TPR) repeat protein